jgi:hypothetical protein
MIRTREGLCRVYDFLVFDEIKREKVNLLADLCLITGASVSLCLYQTLHWCQQFAIAAV